MEECMLLTSLLVHLTAEYIARRQVRYDPFQLRVLFFLLPQAPQLDGAESTVPLLPAVERGFTDAELAADARTRP